MARSWRVLVSDRLAENGMTILQQEADVILDDPGALGTVDAWIVRGRTRVDAASLSSDCGKYVMFTSTRFDVTSPFSIA